MEVNQQDLEKCVSFLLQRNIMAYHHQGNVFVDIQSDCDGISVQITNDNILHFAELYDESQKHKTSILAI